MFTVPYVHFKKSSDHETHKQELLLRFRSCNKETLRTREFDDVTTDWFYCRENNVRAEYFCYVRDALSERLHRVKELFDDSDLEITDMWFQQSQDQQRHSAHTHGAVGLSCIWYLEFDAEVHKATKFYAPYTNPLDGGTLEFVPDIEEGDLFVFPSYLLHEQIPSFAPKRRTIISFNILKRQVWPDQT